MPAIELEGAVLALLVTLGLFGILVPLLTNAHLWLRARRLERGYKEEVAAVKAEIADRTKEIAREAAVALKTFLMSSEADPYIARVSEGAMAELPDLKAELEAAVAPLREKVDRWEKEGLPVPENILSDAQIVRLADVFWERTAALAKMEEGRSRMMEAFQPVMDSMEGRRMARVKAMQEKMEGVMEAGGDLTGSDLLEGLAELGDELGLSKKTSRALVGYFKPYLGQVYQMGMQRGAVGQRKALGPGGGDPFR